MALRRRAAGIYGKTGEATTIGLTGAPGVGKSTLAGELVRIARGEDLRAAVHREVVGLVIRLAHTLGLTVTAESVETPAQFAHLQQLGCDTGQGWFFAASVPAARVPPLASAIRWNALFPGSPREG